MEEAAFQDEERQTNVHIYMDGSGLNGKAGAAAVLQRWGGLSKFCDTIWEISRSTPLTKKR